MSQEKDFAKWRTASRAILRIEDLHFVRTGNQLIKQIWRVGEESLEMVCATDSKTGQSTMWLWSEKPDCLQFGPTSVSFFIRRDLDSQTGAWTGEWELINHQYWRGPTQVVKPEQAISDFLPELANMAVEEMKQDDSYWEMLALSVLSRADKMYDDEEVVASAKEAFREVVKNHPTIRANLLSHQDKWVREKVINWVMVPAKTGSRKV